MLPIAFTLNGTFELLLAVGTMVALNVYEDYYEWETIDETARIRKHEPIIKDSYYCPSYCQVDHVHWAHKTTLNCNHYKIDAQ